MHQQLAVNNLAVGDFLLTDKLKSTNTEIAIAVLNSTVGKFYEL